jgi:hypothetical protein
LLKRRNALNASAPIDDGFQFADNGQINAAFYQTLAKGFVCKVSDFGLGAKLLESPSQDQGEGCQFYQSPVRSQWWPHASSLELVKTTITGVYYQLLG